MAALPRAAVEGSRGSGDVLGETLVSESAASSETAIHKTALNVSQYNSVMHFEFQPATILR